MLKRPPAYAGKIIRIALPLILQQLCLQLQIWIDRAMLGHVNPEFFSAVGNSLVPYQAASSMIIAICGGTTILVAQHYGAGDLEGAQKAAECSFLGNSLISAVAFLFFFLCSDWVFTLMGVQSPVLEPALAYIRILSFTLLVLGPSSTASSVLQALGRTSVIMASGIFSNILNILLDWILIFGKLGFPALGIEGAAYATLIANIFAAPLLILYVFFNSDIPVTFSFRLFSPSLLRHYVKVFAMGAPSGLEFAMWNIGNIIAVSFLNRIDMMAAGIYTLVMSIEAFPLLIYSGFANAGLTLVGQKTGEGDLTQARAAGFTALGYSFLVCLAVAAVFRLYPDSILKLFTDDYGMIQTTVPYLRFVPWIMFPKAINCVIGLCIRGMGDTRWMLYTQIFGSVFMVCCAYFMIFTVGLGLFGIFVTLLADETIRGILNFFHFFRCNTRTSIAMD